MKRHYLVIGRHANYENTVFSYQCHNTEEAIKAFHEEMQAFWDMEKSGNKCPEIYIEAVLSSSTSITWEQLP